MDPHAGLVDRAAARCRGRRRRPSTAFNNLALPPAQPVWRGACGACAARMNTARHLSHHPQDGGTVATAPASSRRTASPERRRRHASPARGVRGDWAGGSRRATQQSRGARRQACRPLRWRLTATIGTGGGSAVVLVNGALSSALAPRTRIAPRAGGGSWRRRASPASGRGWRSHRRRATPGPTTRPCSSPLPAPGLRARGRVRDGLGDARDAAQRTSNDGIPHGRTFGSGTSSPPGGAGARVRAGVKTPFNRGSGDPKHRPNPSLAPLADAPVLRHQDSFRQLRRKKKDPRSRVLHAAGTAIPGLVGCGGSDQANVTGGHYPSGGVNIGPAMTFGFLAGLPCLRKPHLREGDGSRRRRARRAGPGATRGRSRRLVTVNGHLGRRKDAPLTTNRRRARPGADRAPRLLLPGLGRAPAAVAPLAVAWVAEPLVTGESARWRRYDWSADRFAEWHETRGRRSSCSRAAARARLALRPFTSTAVWVETPEAQRAERLRARRDWSGDATPRARWVAQEEALFSAERPWEHADVVVDTGRRFRAGRR